MASPLETQRSHPAPGVTQFSVFLPNRVGKLKELIALLVKQGVHLVALDVVDSVEWAVVRMILSDAEAGRALLRTAGLAFTEGDMLAVELPSCDAMIGVTSALLAAELNVQIIYPLLVAAESLGVVAIRVDDMALGKQVLAGKGYRLLDESGLWPNTGEATGGGPGL